jgi:signal peptidase I
MEQLTKDMNAILEYIDKNRWIAFSKDDSSDRFKAKDKLRAYNLIERHGELSWQLTEEGYKAVELGGFHKWSKNKHKGAGNKKVKTFFVKFWWTFIIPLLVALVIWSLPPKSKSNLEEINKVENSSVEETKLELETNNSDTKNSIISEKNEFYIQSYSPIELFDGELIITLDNSIEYVNQDIKLKIISKISGNSIKTKGAKIGDVIEFDKYTISLLSFNRNISTYDLIIKVEPKKINTGANKS